MDSLAVVVTLLTKVPVVAPPPSQPAVVRVADVRPPESLSTCYQSRSGSCWTEE